VRAGPRRSAVARRGPHGCRAGEAGQRLQAGGVKDPELSVNNASRPHGRPRGAVTLISDAFHRAMVIANAWGVPRLGTHSASFVDGMCARRSRPLRTRRSTNELHAIGRSMLLASALTIGGAWAGSAGAAPIYRNAALEGGAGFEQVQMRGHGGGGGNRGGVSAEVVAVAAAWTSAEAGRRWQSFNRAWRRQSDSRAIRGRSPPPTADQPQSVATTGTGAATLPTGAIIVAGSAVSLSRTVPARATTMDLPRLWLCPYDANLTPTWRQARW
jgi:hypothetical protein